MQNDCQDMCQYMKRSKVQKIIFSFYVKIKNMKLENVCIYYFCKKKYEKDKRNQKWMKLVN